ncbi:hypothetical protein [Methylomicrobium agile]|uniref:hypothetical protein n=1 Tax=Methylomicrobium agile TaxID=39774 RepID=UPI0004DF6B4C|nr:hypothetical protein [Methylomicrobium agile]
MSIIRFWLFWLLPPKFYGGGGGGQTPQVNPEEQMMAGISKAKWEDYKKRYIPLENQWIKQVQGLDNPMYHNQASSLASNEAKMQYGPQTQGLADSMVGGRVGQADYLDQAKTISQARNKANLGVTDRYLQGLEGVIAMGQGQSVQSLQGLSDVANNSVQGQINSGKSKFDNDQGNANMWGTFTGMATAATANSSSKNKT